jgi:hypothetical protein
MLPICSGWLCFACMALCSAQSAEKQAHLRPTLLNAVCFGEPDWCPITTALPDVLPERRVGTFPVNDCHTALVPRVEPIRETLINNGLTSISISGADPPLEHLYSIRI